MLREFFAFARASICANSVKSLLHAGAVCDRKSPSSMFSPFDIFKVGDDGEPQWVQAASTLDAAKVRVYELAALWPGEYQIYCQNTGNRLSLKLNHRGPTDTN